VGLREGFMTMAKMCATLLWGCGKLQGVEKALKFIP
jgi:hypothetical protein